MSLSKYLFIGLGATALGAGVMWLSKESETTKFDPKEHTLAKLHDILEETYLEYACSYIFYHNLINNMKEQGQFSPNMLESIKVKVLEYTKSRDEIVCKRFKITPDLLEQWIRKHQNDSKVQQVLKDISDLHDQAIIKQQMNEIHFHIPEKLTREVYLQIVRKVQACTRHDAYNRVQSLLKSQGKDKLTNEELDDILEKIANESQETYREKALGLYGVVVPEGEKAKRLLQKAYLVYSTTSSIRAAPGQPVLKSRWNEQIQAEQKIHGDILTKIQNGERVEGIEKNPLDSADTDVVVDYSSVPGFLHREKSTISGEDKLRI